MAPFPFRPAGSAIVEVAWRVVIALLVALLAGLALLRFVPRLPFARGLVLASHLGTGPAHGSAPLSDQRWIGKHGRAASVLRPAGIAEIEGERVDVVSEGALIECGAAIQVTHVDGNRIVVRQESNPPHTPLSTPPTSESPTPKSLKAE